MKSERPVAAAFVVSIAGSVIFALAYVFHLGTGYLGLGIILAAGGFCAALAYWGAALLPQEETVDQREEFGAGRPTDFRLSRPGLLRLLAAAAGCFGVALLFPIRSLGPAPDGTLLRTKWKAGTRLVRDNGEPIKTSDLDFGAFLTVFPEGALGDASSQALLLRIQPEELVPVPGREGWTPQGYVAFSKVCTHAGCPVAMYRAPEHQLLCPCHQSLFDVLDGARVLAGPADRPLPQLPLEVLADEYLRAHGDFSAPVGPGFWQHA